MKICVITRCDDFADDDIVLHENQWRYYWEHTPEGRKQKIKIPPFHRGEILLLDDSGHEIGPLQRSPLKWGAEVCRSQGRCSTEFVIVDSIEEAALIQENLFLTEVGLDDWVKRLETIDGDQELSDLWI
jgi:hypothetical protein